MEKGIVVCFPGTGYGCDRPLFTACIGRYAERGYDVLRIGYGGIDLRPIETVGEAIDAVWDAVERQLDDAALGGYGDVVFVSKSFGTAVAGRALKPSL